MSLKIIHIHLSYSPTSSL